MWSLEVSDAQTFYFGTIGRQPGCDSFIEPGEIPHYHISSVHHIPSIDALNGFNCSLFSKAKK